MDKKNDNNRDVDCGDEFTTVRPTQRTYNFDFDQVPERVSVWLIDRRPGKQPREFAGAIEFVELEHDDAQVEVLLIRDLAIEEDHRGWGLGRELISRLVHCYGYVIVAQHPTVSAQTNASHLIADGPAFVSKLVDEGLVEWYNAPQ